MMRRWGMAGADSRTGSWGVRIGLDIHDDTEDDSENAGLGCGCTIAGLVLRRQPRDLREVECNAAVEERYTRLFASLPTKETWGDDFQSQLKNRAMQSSQRNGLVSNGDRKIFSAMLRFDWRTLELPQCGQIIVTPPAIATFSRAGRCNSPGFRITEPGKRNNTGWDVVRP